MKTFSSSLITCFVFGVVCSRASDDAAESVSVFPDVRISAPSGFNLYRRGEFPELDSTYDKLEPFSENIVLARFLQVSEGTVVGDADVMADRSLLTNLFPIASFDTAKVEEIINSNVAPSNLASIAKSLEECYSSDNSDNQGISDVSVRGFYYLPSHFSSQNSFHFSAVRILQYVAADGVVTNEYDITSSALVWIKGHMFSLNLRDYSMTADELPLVVDSTRNRLKQWVSDSMNLNRLNPNVSFERELVLQDEYVKQRSQAIPEQAMLELGALTIPIPSGFALASSAFLSDAKATLSHSETLLAALEQFQDDPNSHIPWRKSLLAVIKFDEKVNNLNPHFFNLHKHEFLPSLESMWKKPGIQAIGPGQKKSTDSWISITTPLLIDNPETGQRIPSLGIFAVVLANRTLIGLGGYLYYSTAEEEDSFARLFYNWLDAIAQRNPSATYPSDRDVLQTRRPISYWIGHLLGVCIFGFLFFKAIQALGKRVFRVGCFKNESRSGFKSCLLSVLLLLFAVWFLAFIWEEFRIFFKAFVL